MLPDWLPRGTLLPPTLRPELSETNEEENQRLKSRGKGSAENRGQVKQKKNFIDPLVGTFT